MNNQEKYDILRQAASVTYAGDLGTWLYDTWASHNQAYFDGRLRPCGIVWGITPHGHALGHYQFALNVITLHTNLIMEQESINPWGIGGKLGERFASDVLLHEMIHQANQQDYPDGMARVHDDHNLTSHNNEFWVSEVNRIAPLLGLHIKASLIKRKRIDGKQKWLPDENCISRDELSRFPYPLKPDVYYAETPRGKLHEYALP